jgi:hypothetical protein
MGGISRRVQFEILLFLFCLNLAIGMVIALNAPGTIYVKAAYNNMSVSDYEAHFNATEIANSWGKSGPFSGIPMIGDIFGGFFFLWQNIQYLVDGFPALITYVGNTFVTDASGQAAFWVVTNAVRAVYALLIVIFLIEFISGRIMSD